jgi:tRNA-splicing ligase RtcB (3'-phosphate/5'-hydroxy nucleic acid ligase)
MQLIESIRVWGTPDEGGLRQIKTCAKTADKVALMADHDKGYAVPIGGVVGYKLWRGFALPPQISRLFPSEL